MNNNKEYIIDNQVCLISTISWYCNDIVHSGALSGGIDRDGALSTWANQLGI